MKAGWARTPDLTEEDAAARTWEGGCRPANESGRLTLALVEIAPGDPCDVKGHFEGRTHAGGVFVILVDVGYLMDDAGIIPLYHVKEYVLVRSHVRGFGISPFGQPDVTGITLLTIAR